MTRRDGLQLFLLPPGPCPYLDGLTEQKAATVIDRRLGGLAPLLIERGFRRSQTMFYRQHCPTCRACISARIRLKDFRPDGGFARVLRKNADLSCTAEPAKATMALYELFTRYLQARHAEGGMNNMSFGDFRKMMEDSPADTRFLVVRRGDDVLGVMLIDMTNDGASAVYSFFDPDEEKRSLGTYMILKLGDYTRAQNRDYLYLGFWVRGSGKMAYKERFQPLELYVNESWVDFTALPVDQPRVP